MILTLERLEYLRRWLVNIARRNHPQLNPRRWSNDELRRYAPWFKGKVVNVSAWRDADKGGGYYRDYFTGADQYVLTNYWGSAKNNDGAGEAIFFDVTAPVPDSLYQQFDVAFAHTVLEHIYDVPVAVRNIAALTKDIMILVVPFIQDEHYTENIFGDYWRMTPLGLYRTVEDAGMKLLYLSANDTPWYPVYLFGIASKQPNKWAGRFPPLDWRRRLARDVFVYPKAAW